MLTKVNYVDDTTVIHAKNLNDIQDAIIELESSPAGGGVLSVNGKTPDDAGALTLIAADVGALSDSEGAVKLESLNEEVTAIALGGINLTKIWENASPTSRFAPQTLELPLGATPKFLVKLLMGITENYAHSSWQLCDLSTNVLVAQTAHLVENYSPTFVFRGCTVSATGIQFQGGAYKSATSQEASYLDNYCIPQEIWLLKGADE